MKQQKPQSLKEQLVESEIGLIAQEVNGQL